MNSELKERYEEAITAIEGTSRVLYEFASLLKVHYPKASSGEHWNGALQILKGEVAKAWKHWRSEPPATLTCPVCRQSITVCGHGPDDLGEYINRLRRIGGQTWDTQNDPCSCMSSNTHWDCQGCGQKLCQDCFSTHICDGG